MEMLEKTSGVCWSQRDACPRSANRPRTTDWPQQERDPQCRAASQRKKIEGKRNIRERLLRAGFSLDTKTTRLERDEIVARPPLGCRTGEDRNVAAPVIVEILDTPLARAEAILVDRHFPMEGIDRGIDEAIPALKACHLRWVLSRHDFFECSWPRVAHGYLNLSSAPNVPTGSFRPILFRLTLHRRRLRVLELEPIRRPARSVAGSQALRDDAFEPHLAGVLEDRQAQSCSRCSFRRTLCRALRAVCLPAWPAHLDRLAPQVLAV